MMILEKISIAALIGFLILTLVDQDKRIKDLEKRVTAIEKKQMILDIQKCGG